MNTRAHGKVLSLSYHAIVILKQLIFFSKVHFPASVFHEITGIADALKINVHDQNEHTIHKQFQIFGCVNKHLTRFVWFDTAKLLMFRVKVSEKNYLVRK